MITNRYELATVLQLNNVMTNQVTSGNTSVSDMSSAADVSGIPGWDSIG